MTAVGRRVPRMGSWVPGTPHPPSFFASLGYRDKIRESTSAALSLFAVHACTMHCTALRAACEVLLHVYGTCMNLENGIFSTAERSDRGEKYFLVTAVFSRVFFSQVSSHLINFFLLVHLHMFSKPLRMSTTGQSSRGTHPPSLLFVLVRLVTWGFTPGFFPQKNNASVGARVFSRLARPRRINLTVPSGASGFRSLLSQLLPLRCFHRISMCSVPSSAILQFRILPCKRTWCHTSGPPNRNINVLLFGV